MLEAKLDELKKAALEGNAGLAGLKETGSYLTLGLILIQDWCWRFWHTITLSMADYNQGKSIIQSLENGSERKTILHERNKHIRGFPEFRGIQCFFGRMRIPD